MLKRLQIMGPAGSGKSTLAQSAAALLGLPYHELDAVFWGPNWTPMPRDAFREAVGRIVAAETWVIGANYTAVRDVIWSRAEGVVWLDLPLAIILSRLLRRTLKRIVTREVLWADNRETWRDAFFSRESLFPFAVKQHARFRRELPAAFEKLTQQGVRTWRLRSSSEAEAWLAMLADLPDSSTLRL